MKRILLNGLLCAALVCGSSAVTAQSATPQVALTFDDLPAHGERPLDESRVQIAQSILDTLRHEHLPPVYGFVNGARVEESPETFDVLKAWHAAGEPLGSHTFSHPDLETMTAAAFEQDIAKNEPLLEQVDPDGDWHWFRYPYLREGETLAKREEVLHYLKQHGYKVAEVSLDFEDYLWNAPYARCLAQQDDARVAGLHDSYLAVADEYIDEFRAMTRRLYGREIPYILLLHVGAFDAKMLPDLIALLRARGFTFTTLPQALSDPAYAVDPAIGFPTGGTLQELAAQARKIPFPPNAKPYEALERMCRPKASPAVAGPVSK